ncbi:MAG: hypothetical protein KGL39_30490 [Patescibacteria group bacterium]|nr:hypothetical protein [Patescibacteria group bacterium]
MNPNWQTFFQYLHDNRVAISLYGSVFFTAIVVTMPETPPKTFQEIWTWSRNALSKHFNLSPKPTLAADKDVVLDPKAKE